MTPGCVRETELPTQTNRQLLSANTERNKVLTGSECSMTRGRQNSNSVSVMQGRDDDTDVSVTERLIKLVEI